MSPVKSFTTMDPEAQLSDAITGAPQRSYSDDLHAVLPLLTSDDFVVVANPHNEITGIVTTADVVDLYRERTQPFLLIGELDRELRKVRNDIAHFNPDPVPSDTVDKIRHVLRVIRSFGPALGG